MITLLAIIGGVVGIGVIGGIVVMLLLARDKSEGKNPFQ